MMRVAAALVAASSIMASGVAPLHAERVVAPVSADCRLGPENLQGGPLYLIHSCFTDRDLMRLAKLAMHAPSATFRNDEAKLSKLRTILGLPQPVLEQFFLIAGQQDIAAEKLADKLVEMSDAHKVLIGDWLAPSILPQPDLEAMIKEAREAAQAGRHDDAQMLLTKASVTAETEAQTAPAMSAKNFTLAASARAGLGQIALIRSQYREAAIYFEAALRLLADSDAARQYAYSEARAYALYLQGKDKDDAAALKDSIERYRTLLNAVPRNGAPARSASLQLNLGNALLRLGARTGETEPLQEALIVFRNALEEFQRARQPLDWARAQQELGATLLRLGLAETGTARLEEAVAAFRESLKEYTRKRAPLEWAATQSSVGTALWSLGSRETGAARFEAAVAAYREGLKQISRDHTPLEWATRQNNLGAALVSLSERKNSLKDLQEAVAAFRNSLEAYQDESATYYIAGVKDNLDRAERMLRQFRATGKVPVAN
jgi:tetratricopeptide (TPR) repeat protein